MFLLFLFATVQVSLHLYANTQAAAIALEGASRVAHGAMGCEDATAWVDAQVAGWPGVSGGCTIVGDTVQVEVAGTSPAPATADLRVGGAPGQHPPHRLDAHRDLSVTPPTRPAPRPPSIRVGVDECACGRWHAQSPRCQHGAHLQGARRLARRLWDQGGFSAGAEVLLFGTLIFFVAFLMAVNAWNLLDADMAATAAAREATRTFVEANTGAQADTDARAAAAESLRSLGRNQPHRVTIDGTLTRCEVVTVTVEMGVDPVRMPGGFFAGVWQVRSTNTEIVDPWRSGLPGPAACG